jgi:hypothetical protein
MAAFGLFALITTTNVIVSPALAQPPPPPPGPPHGGPGLGWLGPAIVGGAILGGLAAPPPGYARECWFERRRFFDEYGRPYVRRVRVCN